MKKVLPLFLLLLCVQLSAQTVQLPVWALGPFKRPAGVNPVISPDSTTRFFDVLRHRNIDWESNDTFNPAAIVRNNKVYVLYRAEDKSGIRIGERTSRIGLAESKDGITMKRRPTPVLFPGKDTQQEFEWPGGCEDPRIAVTADSTYLILYTQWNGKIPRLGAATSKDLRHWKKHGPIFQKAYHGKYLNMATKSASILTELVGGKLVITKFKGEYWIYWGEHHVYAATSKDLVNWAPVLDKNGELAILMSPRKGYFDSDLTECGPPAVVTAKGIVLLYNGKNLPGEGRDEKYTANSYCAGQALFSAQDPAKFIARLDQPYLVPSAPFEKSGQYPAGTVFTEGLVYFKRQWLLYYGCADSRVAVAVADGK